MTVRVSILTVTMVLWLWRWWSLRTGRNDDNNDYDDDDDISDDGINDGDYCHPNDGVAL